MFLGGGLRFVRKRQVSVLGEEILFFFVRIRIFLELYCDLVLISTYLHFRLLTVSEYQINIFRQDRTYHIVGYRNSLKKVYGKYISLPK